MPIVEAVGGMSGGASFSAPAPTSNKIEQAMIDAIKQAQAEGITDSLVIAARMKEAADKAAST